MENREWINPLCEILQIDGHGPFVNLQDGSLMTVETSQNHAIAKISNDDGKTWSEYSYICDQKINIQADSCFILTTDSGVIVVVYLDFTEYKFRWNNESGEPEKDCKLELWSIRSLDKGKTWVDRQRILDGYNANFFSFFKTRKNRIIATVEHLVRNPGHWVVFSLFSDDEGKTWHRSNIIDIGGHGHHDGALEPTGAELNDGSILMLIRTNFDRFWEAYSDDGGRYWRTIKPSGIDASSSPGYLLKLNSGRLVLVWNRLNPEGRVYPRRQPCAFHETETSWHREELSISFSRDDGKNWTVPVLLGKQKDGQISYPYLFERRPGEIWIIAGLSFRKGWEQPFPFKVKIREKDFAG